jgi:thiol-disulfide isomerase/thioredoxin
MSIIQLSSGNFTVKGTSKRSLSIDIPGPVLLLFTADRSPGCTTFLPLFNNLASVETRVRCAIVNISHNRDVVAMSRQTIKPITKTPTLMFYNNGTPIANFSRLDIKSIRSTIPIIQNTKEYMNSQRAGGGGFQRQPAPQFVQPRQAQQPSMYGGPSQPSQSQHIYQPDIGQMPNMKGMLGSNYVEDDDDLRLKRPDAVIPHNVPWEKGDTYD